MFTCPAAWTGRVDVDEVEVEVGDEKSAKTRDWDVRMDSGERVGRRASTSAVLRIRILGSKDALWPGQWLSLRLL